MSSRTTSGANTGADASASLPSPTVLTSWPPSSSSTVVASAASWLSSTTRMRQPARGVGPGFRCSDGAASSPTSLRHGSATRNSEPRPDPALVAVDRALVQADQAMHERQADAEAALAAVERALALLEQLEDVGQQLRLDADAVVAHADHGLALAQRQRQLDRRRPRRCTWRRC